MKKSVDTHGSVLYNHLVRQYKKMFLPKPRKRTFIIYYIIYLTDLQEVNNEDIYA